MTITISTEELVELRSVSNERIMSSLWNSDHELEVLEKTRVDGKESWLISPVEFRDYEVSETNPDGMR